LKTPLDRAFPAPRAPEYESRAQPAALNDAAYSRILL
jgi:hypothetical protein